jgi:hypothetical protein
MEDTWYFAMIADAYSEVTTGLTLVDVCSNGTNAVIGKLLWF